MYESFFSSEALKLAQWALEEKNRVKGSKLYKVACRLEFYYRKYRGIQLDCNVYFNGYYGVHATPVILVKPPKGGSNVIFFNCQKHLMLSDFGKRSRDVPSPKYGPPPNPPKQFIV